MSILSKIAVVLLILFTGTTTTAQEALALQELIESLAENLPEDYDLYELTERLEYYQKKPIDLNRTNSGQLKELFILSPLQIDQLLEHIRKNGKLIDLLELQGISSFDLQTISRLLPFVRLSESDSFSELKAKELINKSKNDLLLRYGRLLHTQKGFRDLSGSRYLGTPDKLLFRYRYTYANRLSAALVAEKDAGESFFNPTTVADHLSANICLTHSGRLKKLVLGDYSLQFGQGLVLSTGFSLGKGPDVTQVAAKELALRPYASSNESLFFRGLANTLSLNEHLDLTSFVSIRKLDASLKQTADGSYTLQNINTSGLHRTATELKNQNSLGQLMFGAALQYHLGDLRLGLLAYQSQYQHTFVTGNQRYNRYAFVGKLLNNTGFNYSYTWKGSYIYGELGSSLDGGWAMINGILSPISAKLSAVLLHRNYQKNYHSFYATGVAEGSENNNEQGWYTGLNYLFSKRWKLSFYGDYFRFPWARYRVDTASSGYEGLVQLSYTPSKTSQFLIRYKRELKQQNPDAGSESSGLQNVLKEQYRLAAIWRLNKKLSFQQRIELSHYQKNISNEWGYLAYADLNYKPLQSKISGNFRFAYFLTPSYNSRIYAYENDVLYTSGFGIYHGQGFRNFINIRYRTSSSIDLFLRYATSIYRNVEKLGSGLDEINGNQKSDFKAQIRYQF